MHTDKRLLVTHLEKIEDKVEKRKGQAVCQKSVEENHKFSLFLAKTAPEKLDRKFHSKPP